MLTALSRALALAQAALAASALEVDVEKYGAAADGRTFSGTGVNAAIAAVAAAGGGTVHMRGGGAYVTGGIELRSHVVLDIAQNSSVRGSSMPEHWTRTDADLTIPPECDGPNAMMPGERSFPRVISPGPRGGLFWANLAKNFTIRGGPPDTPLGFGAVVDGAGQWFNHDFGNRSNMFTFVQCEDVTVSDLTVRNSSAWTLVPIFSTHVRFLRLHISGEAAHHSNTDGFDPLGSEDASFEDSLYEGPGDDCVAIKSGVQVNWTIPYYNVCRRPSRRIYVNNVTCIAAHGITIGSEVSGGVEDVLITNSRLLNSPEFVPGVTIFVYGNGVAMVKIKNECGRGGFVRNVHYENLTGSNMGQGVYASRYGTPPSVSSCNDTGTIRITNITAKNIYVGDAVYSAFEVGGYRSPGAQQQIVDLTLENFTVEEAQAIGSCENADVRLVGAVSAKVGGRLTRFPACTNSSDDFL